MPDSTPAASSSKSCLLRGRFGTDGSSSTQPGILDAPAGLLRFAVFFFFMTREERQAKSLTRRNVNRTPLFSLPEISSVCGAAGLCLLGHVSILLSDFAGDFKLQRLLWGGENPKLKQIGDELNLLLAKQRCQLGNSWLPLEVND